MTSPTYIRTGNSGLQSADHFQAISPSDGSDLAFQTRAIYVGAAGDLTIQNYLGANITFVGLPVGALLPVVTSRVRATGTTAANLVALY
jgi:hypothetical protein